jgi:hypothetical protein
VDASTAAEASAFKPLQTLFFKDMASFCLSVRNAGGMYLAQDTRMARKQRRLFNSRVEACHFVPRARVDVMMVADTWNGSRLCLMEALQKLIVSYRMYYHSRGWNVDIEDHFAHNAQVRARACVARNIIYWDMWINFAGQCFRLVQKSCRACSEQLHDPKEVECMHVPQQTRLHNSFLSY